MTDRPEYPAWPAPDRGAIADAGGRDPRALAELHEAGFADPCPGGLYVFVREHAVARAVCSACWTRAGGEPRLTLRSVTSLNTDI